MPSDPCRKIVKRRGCGQNNGGTADADKRLPVRIQTDNGSEFISKSLDKWAYEHGVTMNFSRPGKPTDNPFIESFNGSLRDECLNIHYSVFVPVTVAPQGEYWYLVCQRRWAR
ncbi:TPA: transposase family protein [Salmonella enterica subsp. enterica serovar Eastbourne]|nr:transposase [Salmonella enterica subsp. enterica serovar Eastbourne]HAE5116311.1 transposase family protein [Salmonella enterica subsp. enterica serovar Eastbourne]HAE8030678.1 transposase family protein [Salmonella enterica subsp. enterica serovar Eastbourne]HDN7459849.1 transposase family protein [Salmonella enterica subsp. enterica serovar Eastbourne]HDN7576895.1 transposase family protein [Salmonella enterica subsp. enterica serovar Eastbourne]